MDPAGLMLSLTECWQVRMQLQQRLEEAMKRIKELEDQLNATEAKA